MSGFIDSAREIICQRSVVMKIIYISCRENRLFLCLCLSFVNVVMNCLSLCY